MSSPEDHNPETPQTPQTPFGIGSALKDARRRAGMDIKEAEDRTKIRARYLRALEAEDWEVLPAPAYVRGFLRTYGQLLELDGEMLADEFRRRHEHSPGVASPASEPFLQERRRAPGARPPSRTPLILAIAAGIIILLVILGSIGGGGDEDGGSADDGQPAKKLRGGDKGDKGDKPVKQKPISLELTSVDAVRVCLVGDGDAALLDGQMIAPGTEESYSGYKRYRLDLQGGGAVKLTVDGDEQRLEAGTDVSYEANSGGVEEIDYAGPGCP